ncbi:LysR family transcriptional regulator [Pollutimonas bauzanensis]|uniref:DNA-binding transcriptional regulator, LysR family n=1 Tax=Pollutimonas bauzanensis TaxID=658167 RepID=A0A1M5ZZM8_9BURK|nr:LysR family transcriptional regulator [Pollutimonas bauzanensis]SHI29586.1 DNA-binding transcriptional regulator, LysR family [Pollutimonas bauzanensis]
MSLPTEDIIAGFTPRRTSFHCSCRRITFSQLRTFVTVVEAQSFRQAGELLARSQSTITQSIKQLEDILGRPLLVRRTGLGSIPEPTEEGKRFLRHAQSMLTELDAAVHEFTDPKLRGAIRLGVPDDFMIGTLQQTVSNCLRTNPALKVQTVSAMPAQILLNLEQQQLDVALIKAIKPFPKVETARVFQSVSQEPLHWVAARECAFESLEEISLALFSDGCVYRRAACSALEQAGKSWNITYTSISHENIRMAVSHGLGISVLPASAIAPEHVVLDERHGFPALPMLHLVLVMNDDGPSHREFASLLIKEWHKTAGARKDAMGHAPAARPAGLFTACVSAEHPRIGPAWPAARDDAARHGIDTD